MYYVVFEYTKAAGGLYLTRTWTAFTDKAEFERMTQGLTKQIAIAEGVSEADCLDYTALTPELSRITSAVEQSCLDDSVDFNLFKYHLANSIYAIEFDREHCMTVGLLGNLIRKTPEDFLFLTQGQTSKNRLMKAVVASADLLDGSLDFEKLNHNLEMVIHELSYNISRN